MDRWDFEETRVIDRRTTAAAAVYKSSCYDGLEAKSANSSGCPPVR